VVDLVVGAEGLSLELAVTHAVGDSDSSGWAVGVWHVKLTKRRWSDDGTDGERLLATWASRRR
jgi:hypothetical protein